MLINQRTRSRAAAGAAIALSLACVLTSRAALGSAPGGTEQTEAAPGFLAVADEALTGTGALTVQLDYDTSEADGLDPQTAQTTHSWMIMGLVYETLVTTDEIATSHDDGVFHGRLDDIQDDIGLWSESKLTNADKHTANYLELKRFGFKVWAPEGHELFALWNILKMFPITSVPA